ncbi:MAG: efflux RND transporter permease subunit [Alphaproteobacteria bacterium]|nr:MAG: efflux RND transporter permease subunit [Alphaproteobacteria bacterium]
MKTLIRWFVENHVASVLLMVGLVVAGLLNFPTINRMLFPAIDSGRIIISVPYRGAGPEEVEEQVLLRVEAAVAEIQGIDRMIANGYDGRGEVILETKPGTDTQKILNEVKSAVDSIITFPREVERPNVQEQIFRNSIMAVAIYGHVDESVLVNLGEKIRDDMSQLPNSVTFFLEGFRNYEIAIEVSETSLRKYGLTFDDVANAIRGSSINLPAGAIKTTAGDIEVKTRGQGYTARDFEDVIVLRRDDGTQLQVRDIATVREGFEETNYVTRFNGVPGVFINVMNDNKSDDIKVSQQIHEFVDQLRPTLPEGVMIEPWIDVSDSFKARMDMLTTNSLTGLILVFAVLFLFLRPAVAIWVTIGIFVSFVAPFTFIAMTDVSINMISTFAFLLVLGIVVDDAIIVGESVHYAQEHGHRGKEAAIFGTQRVAKPIIFAAVTTMIAFSIMFFLPGNNAQTIGAIPIVVILVLTFSLIECFFILPHHLASMKPAKTPTAGARLAVHNFQRRFADGFTRFARNVYRPLVEKALDRRYTSMAAIFMVFAVSIAVLKGGWVKTEFAPSFNMDMAVTNIQMPAGTSFERLDDTLRQLEDATRKYQAVLEEKYPHPDGSFFKYYQGAVNGNQVNFWIELQNTDEMRISMEKLIGDWLEIVGPVVDAEDFRVNYTANNGGPDLQIMLVSEDPEVLNKGVERLRDQLATYKGVHNIGDMRRGGRSEYRIRLKPEAENLSLTLADVARQVRQAFYGEQVQRFARGRNDVRVMVRYPREYRETTDSLFDMRIRTPDGRSVPFSAVAEMDIATGYTSIRREERHRVNYVWAYTSEDGVTADEIMKDLRENHYSNWQREMPDLKYQLSGFQREQSEFMAAFLRLALFALAAIYMPIAIAFRSYTKPLIVMSAIPFGIMGAIFGHLIMGLSVSIMTYFGIIAAAGVVVNDNLVLVDYVNKLREEGVSAWDAIKEGAESRFRPIVLTSLTTFAGLFPIMLEQGVQAAFLSQMVVALAFGVLFATTVTLILVPCLLGMGVDVSERIGRLKAWWSSDSETALPEAAE